MTRSQALKRIEGMELEGPRHCRLNAVLGELERQWIGNKDVSLDHVANGRVSPASALARLAILQLAYERICKLQDGAD